MLNATEKTKKTKKRPPTTPLHPLGTIREVIESDSALAEGLSHISQRDKSVLEVSEDISFVSKFFRSGFTAVVPALAVMGAAAILVRDQIKRRKQN